MLLLYHTKQDSARGLGAIIFFFVRRQDTPHKFIMDIIELLGEPLFVNQRIPNLGNTHVCLQRNE